MNNSAVRRSLAVLPWLMIASAIMLIVMSFMARDAASTVRYNPWTPTIGGIIFSIPLLIAGLIILRSVRDRTARGFLLQKPRLVLGVLGLLMWIALGWAYGVQIGDSSTYEGGFNTTTRRWEPNFSERSFFALTLGMALVYPTGVSIAAAKYLYLGAIQPASATVSGRDPMGEMIAERTRS